MRILGILSRPVNVELKKNLEIFRKQYFFLRKEKCKNFSKD